MGPYLRTLIERLRVIPETDKQFVADAQWAASSLAMTEDVIAELVEAGVPARPEGERVLLDSSDLTSISYAYSGASPNRKSAQLWARQLRSLHSFPAGHEVGYVVQCPVPGHSGNCGWRFLAPESGGCTPTTDAHPIYSLSTPASRPPVEAPRDVTDIVDRYADVSFHILPTSLMGDTDFVRRRRLAECDTMAQTVVEDALRAGIEARTASGLIVARPYSSTHSWAEFRIQNAWVPYDAFLIHTMQGWNIPGARELDPHMSLDGFLLRLSERREPLVTHRGEPVQPALPTRRVSASASALAN